MDTTSRQRSSWDLPRWAFAALALGLPLLLFFIHRTLGHQGDMRFFFEWYGAVRDSAAFYRDGPGINYPIVGVLWLTAPAWLVEAARGAPLTFEAYREVLKLTLTAAEVLLIVVISRFARDLGLRRPRLLAIAVYLLPSTWGMGAWFGQIDVIGSLLLVLAAWAALRCGLAISEEGRWKGWLALGLAALHGAVLTKQLTFFSIPVIALMLGAALFAQRRPLDAARRIALGVALASPLVWIVADTWLVLPEGYSSHLDFVLAGGGSTHGDLICGSGANLWGALYPPEVYTSARETLLWGVALRTWGIALFLAVETALVVLIGLWVRRSARGDGEITERIRAAMGLGALLVGGSNLAMATLLTGVHERYLVHGVPFLILGLASALRRAELDPRRCLQAAYVGTWLVGAWAGLFALATIHWRVFSTGPLALFQSNEALASTELALLVWVLVVLAWRARRSRAL